MIFQIVMLGLSLDMYRNGTSRDTQWIYVDRNCEMLTERIRLVSSVRLEIGDLYRDNSVVFSSRNSLNSALFCHRLHQLSCASPVLFCMVVQLAVARDPTQHGSWVDDMKHPHHMLRDLHKPRKVQSI
jgi:hypothetical protein